MKMGNNNRTETTYSGQNPKNSPLPLRTGGYDEPVGVYINTPPHSDSSRKRHNLNHQLSSHDNIDRKTGIVR